MNKTVLIVDNDQDFLDSRAERLADAGYTVFKAASLEKAENLLQRMWIHIALIDVRMRRDSDAKDTSGLALARKAEYRAIAKIMLTRYPSFEYVRAALGPAVEGLPPAVDFLAKQDGSAAMLRAVEQAFEQYVGINWDLVIRWQERVPCRFAGLVELIEPNLELVLLANRVSELGDLLRKLFVKSTHITFSRHLWHRRKRVALEVFAFSQEQVEQFVVICGPAVAIKHEQESFERSAPKAFIAAGTSMVITAETRHYAATAMTISQPDTEDTQTLQGFFRANPDSRIRAALENLVNVSVGAWLHGGRFVEEGKTLAQAYREGLELTPRTLPPTELRRTIAALAKEATTYDLATLTFPAGQLEFQFPNGQIESFPDPTDYLYDDKRLPQLAALSATTPGSLEVDTVLVSDECETWLTDFSLAGPKPIWQDYVSLERSVRSNLVAASNLITLRRFEEQLMVVDHLAEATSSAEVEPEYRKAFSAIQTIRRLAAKAAGDDPLPYYVGLLFSTAQDLAAFDPALKHSKREVLAGLQNLLLAALLCKAIARAGASVSDDSMTPKELGLRVDEEKHEVWVRGREVALSPTEFRLLLYLYRRSGQLCKRADIVRDVFDYEGASPQAERDLVNTPIYRLRNKIERDPRKPVHILTVHGEGYKLVLQPG